jgi:hypothetical protein
MIPVFQGEMGRGYVICYTIYPLVWEYKPEEKSFLFFSGCDARLQSLIQNCIKKKLCVRMAQSVSETNRLTFNPLILKGRISAREAVSDGC